MTPQQRAEGLAAAARSRREGLLALAEAVAGSAHVHLVAPPAAASTMVELATAAGSFCLCEVIVTTAQVRCNGRSGWGCVLGWDREGALAAALLDALPVPAVDELAAAALAAENEERAREARLIGATKV